MLLMAGGNGNGQAPLPFFSKDTIKQAVWKLLLAGRSEDDVWEQVHSAHRCDCCGNFDKSHGGCPAGPSWLRSPLSLLQSTDPAVHVELANHQDPCKPTGCDAAVTGHTACQVLVPDVVAMQLAAVHANIAAACAPPHQLAALQPLWAVIAVLGARACTLPTLRYAVHIVLQLVDIM